VRPKNRFEDESLRPHERAEGARALRAAARARRSSSDRLLPPAAAAEHTTVDAVRKWLPGVVQKDDRGRVIVTKADRAYRLVTVIERGGGPVEVSTHGSRVATRASQYANCLRLYRAGLAGPEVFAPFEGKRVGGVELEADADRIDELDAMGELEDFQFHSEKL